MRILSEFIGGIVLLMIFAYGVRASIKFFNLSTQEKENHDHDGRTDESAGN